MTRIHLAAAFDSTISGLRLIADADRFDWNELIDTVQKLAPSAAVSVRLSNPDIDLGESDNAPGLALMNKWWDQKEYTSLEQTVRENSAGAT